MASDLNRVMIIGNLTKDPEIKTIGNDNKVANFSIANTKSYKKNDEKVEETSFFEIVAWRGLAGLIESYCKKGQKVAVEGRLQQKSWTQDDGQKRYKVEIVADNVQFLSGKSDSQPGANISDDNIEY